MKTLKIDQAKNYIGCQVQYNGEKLFLAGVSEPNNSHNINYPAVLLIDEQGFADYGIDGWVDIKDIKLILHNLSDLTKEIEVNGEKFVPMIELAKIAYKKNNKFELINDYIVLGFGYSFHIDIKEISFDCRTGYNGERWDYNCYVPSQLQLFQKLFEWHFDVFGLIKQGLAIDINTLKS